MTTQPFPLVVGTDFVRCDKASTTAIDSYLPGLNDQLNRYPAESLRKAGLKYVVLCSGLISTDGDIGGLFVRRGPAIFYDVESPDLRTIHHELFHLIDFCNGQLDCDPDWPTGKLPYVGVKEALARQKKCQGKPPAGFYTWDSMASPAEDKAELFANMVCDRYSVAEAAKADDVINQKIAAVRKRVVKFDPDLCAALLQASGE